MDDAEITQWPPPAKRPRPDWISHFSISDTTLVRILREVYDALDADLSILTAIGIRTAFDRAAELLKIPDGPFATKLDALVTKGAIGTDERRHLDALVDAGSAAAHRGWIPDERQLTTMMDIIENFLYRSFVLPSQSKSLQAGVPPRGPRRT
jgi:hypothetical protein